MSKYLLSCFLFLFSNSAFAQQFGQKYLDDTGSTLGIKFEAFRAPFNQRMDFNDDGKPEIVTVNEDDQGTTTGIRILDFATKSTLLELDGDAINELFGVARLRVLSFMDLDGDKEKEIVIIKRVPQAGKQKGGADYYADFNSLETSSSVVFNDSIIGLVNPVPGFLPSILGTFPSRASLGKRASNIEALSAFTIADIDGDGKLDIIIGDETAGLIEAWGRISTSTGVENEQISSGRQARLLQNYPNPFGGSTTIQYEVAEQDLVKMKIYDSLGREIRTLVNGLQAPGLYNVEWNGRNDADALLVPGIYFYQLRVGQFTASRQMILLR